MLGLTGVVNSAVDIATIQRYGKARIIVAIVDNTICGMARLIRPTLHQFGTRSSRQLQLKVESS